MDRVLEWLRDQVILGSPYCTLWADDYVVTGKKLQYVKRCTLCPSIVITGKMIHEAKERRRRRSAVKREWHVMWYAARVTIHYPLLRRV